MHVPNNPHFLKKKHNVTLIDRFQFYLSLTKIKWEQFMHVSPSNKQTKELRNIIVK